MHLYCTLFDRNYLSRGLALYRSIVRHGADFTLHMLALDRATADALSALALKGVNVIPIEVLEKWDPELREARRNRSVVEFYFTCKPVLLRYLFDHDQAAARITYLDSDLYFFSDPAPFEDDLADSSVHLTPHRFVLRHAALGSRGRFNAGWLSASASTEGRAFVDWWRERCLEWCRLVVEETRFGDQKYLDRVPALFPRTRIISHPGANLAPWNIIAENVELSAGGAMVEGLPLQFFHFHGTKRLLFALYDCGLSEYRVPLTPAIKQGIYRPYLTDLSYCERQLAALPPGIRAMLTDDDRPPDLGAWSLQIVRAARALARRSAVFAAT